jgi:proteasome lid subunit RPN8/RPN11
MQLKLTPEHFDIMRAHVESQAPLESCGLLAGLNDTVEKVLLVRNQAQSPVRFRMDPVEQLRAFDWMESNGLDLLGIFHSHPAGPETMSATDVAEAAYPAAQLIWSRLNGIWRVRGFRIENLRVREIKLQLIAGE